MSRRLSNNSDMLSILMNVCLLLMIKCSGCHVYIYHFDVTFKDFFLEVSIELPEHTGSQSCYSNSKSTHSNNTTSLLESIVTITKKIYSYPHRNRNNDVV